MEQRWAIVPCLVASGLTALVYQIIWTRQLGFAFGTTTEAIGTVLAVFFGGLALGNALAARWLLRVRRPLRIYALLELGIGVFALASLPVLRRLDALYAQMGTGDSPEAMTAIRLAGAAAILLPPTLAMGATLPVVARGLVREDATLGRWSAILYAANTLGAVLGAYLCGFWLVPELGLSCTLAAAGALNLAIAAVAFAVAGRSEVLEGPSAAGALEPGPPVPAPPSTRIFLAFFAVSGFVAIGYEIVWSKVFGIVMEGTLYGFAAVLSAYLLGLGLGSLVVAAWIDRIRDLPRAFGLLHLGIAVSVALGASAIPYLPYAHRRLAAAAAGGDDVHLLFALVTPIVLVPTALFGAAFPVLIRIYTRRAPLAGRGMGIATAVNTAGSIAASLIVGFWWIPRMGMDAALFLLLLLDLGIALLVLLRFQESRGLPRIRVLAGSVLLLFGVVLSYGGVHVEKALAGRQVGAPDLSGYDQQIQRSAASQALLIEGRSSIMTVSVLPGSRLLRTNGLSEGGFRYAPPHYPLEPVLLGLLPYAAAEAPERALVIGLGAGNTVNALRRTRLESIEVVELESGVADAMEALYAGRENPLSDPRVSLRIGDGRHQLLLGKHRGGPGYDVIASQPSHPWRIGAANLFTEEFFRLARANLSETGLLALWVNGFRIDSESLLAVIASFERVFDGSLLVDVGESSSRNAFLLLGGRRPLECDPGTMAQRLAQPGVAELLQGFELDSLADVLARFEGPAAAFAALAPGAANTDDNAFIETRIPRQLDRPKLDFRSLEARLAPDTPVLPPLRGELDIAELARAMLRSFPQEPRWPYAAKLARLLERRGAGLEPVERATLSASGLLRDPASESEALAALRALADAHADRPEPLRALGLHLAQRRSQFSAAAAVFAEAHARSGSAADAYDAGRALHPVDPAGAWSWFERIPEQARSRFPRLGFYRAERALAQGLRGEALRPVYTALLRYRDTREGRSYPGVNELLSRSAYALGELTAARGFADAAQRERASLGELALGRAETALDRDQIGDAIAALEEARSLLPADERVARLRVRIAIERGDASGLEDVLRSLGDWAPSLGAAVAAENRLRSVHALPLLPEHPRRD